MSLPSMAATHYYFMLQKNIELSCPCKECKELMSGLIDFAAWVTPIIENQYPFGVAGHLLSNAITAYETKFAGLL